MIIMRPFVLAVALVAAWFPCARSMAAPRSELILESTAARHGLTRPWFTQIQMDPTRTRVRDVVLHEGILYVQTDRAMLHVIDAETGQTLWAKQVGQPNHPSLTPAVGQDLLAVINGSRLYVCNRFNGDLLYQLQLEGVPGAGPCLSQRRVYVPMVNGPLEAYRLQPLADSLKELGKTNQSPTPEQIAAAEEDRRENLRLRQQSLPPLVCRSLGRVLVQPLVTRETEKEEFVAWATDRGYLYVGGIDLPDERHLAVEYRLQTAGGIAARPTYLPPDPNDPADSGIIFVSSQDGFVYAVREHSGKSAWQFPTGDPILQPAVVIDERVYVANQSGGMYCLDAKTGSEIWWTPQIRQLVAVSKEQVYAADDLGRILILRADTGTRVDMMATEQLPIKLVNSETDRLYLATDAGLIQCLREPQLSQPIRHGEARKKKPQQKPPEIQQKGIEEVKPAEGPSGPKQQPPGADEDPFN
jgi:outer membrane protein assembly factor BamB